MTLSLELVRSEALISTSGSAGVAKICLVDADVRLKPQDEIVVSATTVFEEKGSNSGNPKDPASWHYEIKERFGLPAEIITLERVTLRTSNRCTEAKVQFLVREQERSTSKRVSNNHLFAMADVIDYPIPTARPPIEIGKLIDDVSILAVLTADINQTIIRSGPASLDDAKQAAICLAGAKKLAGHLGGVIRQQRSANVEIGLVGVESATYGCPFGPKQKPDFAVYWNRQPRPPSNVAALISSGGEFVIGATREEIVGEMSACITAALKPDASELADREIRGVKIECQAFLRDGGGGSVTIYRRFGPDPARGSAKEM
jgi:hypothetical protein